MTIAVDTNVLLDVIESNPQFAAQSQEWIDIALSRGDVIICAVVYGELVPSFDSKVDMDARLRAIGVALSPIDDAIAYEAGLRWRRYRQSGGPRARLLPDFLIGAHALVSANTFLTRDQGFYRSYFPELQGL
jgi:predicted nucleic acid-binding protein